MDDFTRYEAMRDAGATPREVYLAAKQHNMEEIKAILVLRKVFGLSLADAWQVTKLEPASHRALDMSQFWCVMAIDRHTRAPVMVSESIQPPEVLRALMVRPPTIDRADFVSWGNVTRAELEALIQSEYLWLEDDALATHPPDQVMWSIFHGKR